ncbi:class I SAM-dependent methyltransferase [Longispora sp. K20-0274]|uniref:class I SAM-dependent methyltransferase n=1 Tax=Longispora sp. K20-0274 TaxID=3088255 RepID=UPI00399C477C
MSDSVAPSSVTELLDSFAHADPELLDEEYQRLVRAVWVDGTLTDLALPAVPDLVAGLARLDDPRRGHVLVLLALLAEAEYPALDGPVATAVRGGLDTYLDLLAGVTRDEPLALALLYLLSHFPDDRDRILGAAGRLALTVSDQSRLERCLSKLDLYDVVLGRAWPSPHDWALSDAEHEFDRGWVRTLTPEQITATWDADNWSMWAYSGARAYWAQTHGMPTPVPDTSPFRDTVQVEPTDPGIGVFARHADVFRCPTCQGTLDVGERGVRCADCGTAYPVTFGILDLSRRTLSGAGVSEDPDVVKEDVLQLAAAMRSIGYHYETALRPAFLQVMGTNWSGLVTPSDEDRYITEHASPAGGPVLDLAAGAGRWTAVLSKATGAERVIALDLNDAMLYWLRGRLPEVTTVRASALDLPFADASLDAVSCWNALQAIPDAAGAIAEAARVLKPGGTLTLMTFRWADDPVYRYFQAGHRFPARPEGFLLFDAEDIRSWVAAAGLKIREEHGPGTFVFLTAEKG